MPQAAQGWDQASDKADVRLKSHCYTRTAGDERNVNSKIWYQSRLAKMVF